MSTPTPETDAALSFYCESDVEALNEMVDKDFARRLERERNQLQRWKEEMLVVWKKWDEVDAAVRKHPGTVVGHNISDTVLRFIKERDELSWIPVTERRPTEEDANEYGDVEYAEKGEVYQSSFDKPREATHWRRIVLP